MQLTSFHGQLRLLLTLVLTTTVVMAASGAAVAATWDLSRRPAVVLRQRFTLLPGAHFAADDRYVFITTNPSSAGFSTQGVGVVLDTRTGRRTSVSRSGCLPTAFGGPWLAFACGPFVGQLTYELDNVVTGQIRPVSSTASNPNQGCDTNCAPIVGVGSQWVALEAPAFDYHDLPTIEFQNLQTGEVRRDPRSASTDVNLDLPGLSTNVCSPLSVPAYSNQYSSSWGSLTFDGGFAVAVGSDGMYLEHCGSLSRQFLTFTVPGLNGGFSQCPAFACPPAINAHEVIWTPHANELKGMFFPSRQRFAIRVPARIAAPLGKPPSAGRLALALVGKKLYLSNSEHVWTIPMPAEPAPPRKRHRN